MPRRPPHVWPLSGLAIRSGLASKSHRPVGKLTERVAVLKWSWVRKRDWSRMALIRARALVVAQVEIMREESF